MRFAGRVAFYIATVSFLLSARTTDVLGVSTTITESLIIAAVLWLAIVGVRWFIRAISGPKRS